MTSTSKDAPESGYAVPPPNLFGVDFGLRLLLLASAVSALVVLVTSKQTESIPTSLPPPFPPFISRDAKFQHSPAFIYLLVALSVTCFYSIITVAASFSAITSPSPSPRMLFHLVLSDAVMAGVTASATGSAGSVAYLGLKGNSHVNWNKVCNVYDKFCRHVGSSAAVSLAASVLLVSLVMLSVLARIGVRSGIFGGNMVDVRPSESDLLGFSVPLEIFSFSCTRTSCKNLPKEAALTCLPMQVFREGPDHAPRFKATVDFNGETFESPTFCSTLRQAEHAAAEVALNTLSNRGPSRSLAAKVLDETGIYKNLLQETAHRAGMKLPVYTTVRSGPGHTPIFTCTVELAGMSFTGDPAKTKKQAQKNAAMAAWSALKHCE
ncbi:Double-stranded RNA binding motif [Musa troglodytarum]|uniref:CASP-like protein n=1 Tax=Musa troglodytarum TaxID=320322 RepID=A0A9E7FYI0_9LILI|nr:Double-stranded RNA binding motif [Musa troglodytarum]